MKLLVIEDELALQHQIRRELIKEGFTVDQADNGEDGQFLGETERYDAIVLDLTLPTKDGTSVLKEWRDADIRTPVIILTARSRWQDRVAGLNAGGDDYLAKPFRIEELVARLQALIRRSAGLAAPQIELGDISLNTESGRVYCCGNAVDLTGNELKLLKAMMLRPDKVHSKSELSEKIYGYFEERDSNTVEVYVAQLRQKIGRYFIQTIRGRGYTIRHHACPDR
ncbi:MAG: response regulator transcription factor [Roseibium sp.]|uniref:response regulator transcription factor n=1 Tax=Roseibium sp. TaxID=1936156 RepID=UPI00260D9A1C|nr:response regulator transcription factor [Roseibium sp.]MCV0424368.1 response regulator transcription factor [Roseibium sp.]